MSRRLSIRKSDLAAAEAAVSAFKERGLTPLAVEIAPDGRLRFQFGAAEPADELDRELADWQARRA